MNIYFTEDHFEKDPQELLNSMKEAVEDFYRGFVLKPSSAYHADLEKQFFFEAPDSLIWGRIYDQLLTESDMQQLLLDLDIFSQNSRDDVTLYVFFPGISGPWWEQFDASKYAQFFEGHESKNKVRFFEYAFLTSREQDGISLKEYELSTDNFIRDEALSHLTESKNNALDLGFRFYQQGKLNRLEIAELAEMSLRIVHSKK